MTTATAATQISHAGVRVRDAKLYIDTFEMTENLDRATVMITLSDTGYRAIFKAASGRADIECNVSEYGEFIVKTCAALEDGDILYVERKLDGEHAGMGWI